MMLGRGVRLGPALGVLSREPRESLARPHATAGVEPLPVLALCVLGFVTSASRTTVAPAVHGRDHHVTGTSAVLALHFFFFPTSSHASRRMRALKNVIPHETS